MCRDYSVLPYGVLGTDAYVDRDQWLTAFDPDFYRAYIKNASVDPALYGGYGLPGALELGA